MPEQSSVATFNQARRTGVTKTTKALKALLDKRDPQLISSLRSTSPFLGMPSWLRTALRSERLSPTEIDHVAQWPDEQKDRVRNAVVDALDENRSVDFRWKLWDQSQEGTIVRQDDAGSVTITFYSPWDKLRAEGPNDIRVIV